MRFVAACLLMFVGLGGRLAAQTLPVVHVQALLASKAAPQGSTVRLAVIARITSGYHINSHQPSLDYLIPTRVNFENTADLKVTRVVYPAGKLKKFAFLDSPISVYEGETRIDGNLQVSRLLAPGSYALKADFAYQACNRQACLPPAKVPFEVALRVVAAGVRVKPSHPELFQHAKSP